jgi:hypothetical protein
MFDRIIRWTAVGTLSGCLFLVGCSGSSGPAAAGKAAKESGRKPLTVAVIFSLIRGHGVARRVLLPHFAVQCYLQSPALLGVMPIVVGLLFAPHAEVLEHLRGSVFVVGLGGLAVLWLLTAETRYLMRDLNTSPRRAFRIAAGGLALSALIVGSLAVGAAHVLYRAHLLLPHP